MADVEVANWAYYLEFHWDSCMVKLKAAMSEVK
jgi:hypothetical protein